MEYNNKLKKIIIEIAIKSIKKLRGYIDKSLYSLNRNLKLLTSGYEENENINQYEKLSPIKLDDDIYLTEIDYALIDEDIKNIALSGPYGIGKSSILKTYIYKRPLYNYLSISLANFTQIEGSRKSGNDGSTTTQDILYELESNILKQMFYKVKHNKIPYSRYRRIKNLTNKKIVSVIIGIGLLVVTGTFLHKPSKIKDILYLKKNDFTNVNEFYIIVALMIFILLSSVFLVSIIKYVKSNLRLNNIKTKNMEISKFDDKEFIFNKNIDEIVYFFEVSNYDVVIFEDLDRFNNIDIFIKLRELNELINNSHQIGRKVTFIYAIKDEIFGEYRERTKFFDFIIPVIPIMNSSNSEKYLKDRLSGFKISEELIEGISVYIEDMRILKNICNEFKLYKGIVNYRELDKLFAIIVYKNIYHKDFVKLQFNKGMISKVLNLESRENLIERLTKHNIKDIDDINKNYESKIQELQKEYLKEIYNLDIMNLYINGIESEIDDISNIFKDNFDLKTKIEFEYEYYDGLENNCDSRIITKEKLLEIGSPNSYYDKKKIIENWKNKRLDQVRDKLNTDQNIVTHGKAKDLIERFGVEEIILDEDIRKEKIIIYLLEKGYIDESYNSYIVQNKNGNGSINDIEFIKAVKKNDNLMFNYIIDDPVYIINRVNESDLKKSSILNYTLFKFLVENKEEYNKYYILILEYLINGINSKGQQINNRKCREFLYEIIVSEYRATVLTDIALKYNGIWDYIYSNKSIEESVKGLCLIGLLSKLDLSKIGDLNKDNKLVKYIESENYITFVDEELDKNKKRKIIKMLGINTSKIMFNKATIAMKRSDYEESLRYYNWSIERDSANVESYIGRGILYKFLGDYERSIHDYQQAINIDDKNVNAYKYIAEIHLSLNEYEEAKELLIKAAKLDPKNNDVKIELERVMKKLSEDAIEAVAITADDL